MIDKICIYLMKILKQKNPNISEEELEVANFGLQLIVGEVPKIIILIGIAFLLGIGPLTLLAFILILPYKTYSGGFHLKTHIGCIIGTTLFYCGNVFISKNLVLEPIWIKYVLIFVTWIFGMMMCKKYAPADTENVPIISKTERNKKRKLSYITLTISLIIAVFIPYNIISNIIIIGMIMQSISISRFAYNITKNKYGYELYGMQ
ncbi:MAG: accessory gene regulator B family protein [Clostridia bacterium]|nr:accessory gene regulator B family protein [Clostridia bacterium]